MEQGHPDEQAPAAGDAAGLLAGMERLSLVTATTPRGGTHTILPILAILADALEAGAAFFAHAEGDTLRIDGAVDRAGMGMRSGDVIPLEDTYCRILLAEAPRTLVVEDARSDARVAALATTRDLGIGAYSGVPLYRGDGRLFGTLCTLHPAARRMRPGESAFLALAGRLVMQVVEAEERWRHEEQARQEVAVAARVSALFAAMAGSVVVLNAEGEIVDANPAAEELLGAPLSVMRGQMLVDSLWSVQGLDGSPLPVAERPTVVSLRTGLPQRGVAVRLTRPDGQERVLEINTVPLHGADGSVQQVIVSYTDLTARVRAEGARAASDARVRALTEQASDLVSVVNAEGIVTYSSPSHARILGVTVEQEQGSDAFASIHPEDRGRVRTAFAAALGAPGHAPAVVFRRRAADGTWRWLETVGNNVLTDPAIAGIIITSRDITARMELEAQLRHQAVHDALTGLPNRTLFAEQLERTLAVAEATGRSACLLLLDLDGFKEVNDTLGHQAGDTLLQQLAERLQRALGAAEMVARLGGDEFAILLPGADSAEATTTARLILEALQFPFQVEGYTLEIEGSIGIARFPEHGLDGQTLLRRADVAMYGAKRARGGCAAYDPDQDFHSVERLALLADLREAIDGGTLALHYQPKVDLRTGRALGVEALVRWRHPRRGAIGPDQFIPLAEQTGLIAPLTRWVLEEALRQSRAWQQAGLRLGMAVNLSARTLQDRQLPNTIAAVLQRHRMAPANLTLEITESALMHDPEGARTVLGRLRAAGVHVAIDDFGTGYSSLGYLKQLPVDEIKIDRSFVRGLGMANSADDAIVRTIVELGHNLELLVVAEGVENQDAWERLRSLGCDLAQGYFLSRPVPATELERWLVDASGCIEGQREVGVG